MPQGIQVWNAAGTLVLDTSRRAARILGFELIYNVAGSVTNAGFATGSPWAAFNAYTTWFDRKEIGQLNARFSGNTLLWDKCIATQPNDLFLGWLFYGIR